MTVRDTTDPADADWGRLRAKLWPHCASAQHAREMAELLGKGGLAYLVQDSTGDTVGFVEVSIRREYVEGSTESPIAYIEGWFVEESSRKKGYGAALIRAAAAWAEKNGFAQLASDADMENVTGVAAHAGVGFREVGRRVCFLIDLDGKRL